MNILVKVRMRAAHQPLKERLHALDTNFNLWAEIPREQVCLRGSSAARWTPYAAGWKAKIDVLAGVPFHFRLEPEKASKIKDRRSASPVLVGRWEVVHRHVMHIRIVGRQFSKVLTQCGFSGYQQNQPNEKRFSHNHPLTSKDLACNRSGKRPTFQISVPIGRSSIVTEGLNSIKSPAFSLKDRCRA
jgi:hypothetical protein